LIQILSIKGRARGNAADFAGRTHRVNRDRQAIAGLGGAPVKGVVTKMAANPAFFGFTVW
jgi:hypothetical protein